MTSRWDAEADIRRALLHELAAQEREHLPSSSEVTEGPSSQAKTVARSSLRSGEASKSFTAIHESRQVSIRCLAQARSGRSSSDKATPSQAAIRASGNGAELQVGGLIHYQAIQSKFLGFIPMGPESIVHFGFYQRFLQRVRDELIATDPAAEVAIGIFED